MSKQLGVKGAQNDRFNIGALNQMLDLFGAADHEITGVITCCALGPSGHVDLLVGSESGDPVIFDAGESS